MFLEKGWMVPIVVGKGNAQFGKHILIEIYLNNPKLKHKYVNFEFI